MTYMWTNRVYKLEEYSPEAAQREQIELLVKAGRRCAYDLAHAADMIHPSDPFAESFRERAKLWQKVFNPADDGKNYRHYLHGVIDNLESKISTLEDRCRANNIDISDIVDPDIPF